MDDGTISGVFCLFDLRPRSSKVRPPLFSNDPILVRTMNSQTHDTTSQAAGQAMTGPP